MCAGVWILQGRTGEAGGPDDRLASQLWGVGLPEWSGPWTQVIRAGVTWSRASHVAQL